MQATIREMTLDDYDQVTALWEASEGVGLSSNDSRDGIAAYLGRNAGLSFVAVEAGRTVAAVLCGHDGRRGFLHHLAVAASHRRRGLGRALVRRCLEALARAGIRKCHTFAFAPNVEARNFYTRIGWQLREDLVVMSRQVP